MDALDAWAAFSHSALVPASDDEWWQVQGDSVGEWVCIPRVGDVSVPDLLRAVADQWEAGNGHGRLGRG